MIAVGCVPVFLVGVIRRDQLRFRIKSFLGSSHLLPPQLRDEGRAAGARGRRLPRRLPRRLRHLPRGLLDHLPQPPAGDLQLDRPHEEPGDGQRVYVRLKKRFPPQNIPIFPDPIHPF